MTAELQGRVVNGWLVNDYIDCGKSALVLRAERAGVSGAIKIFDRELIERFGREVQAERIKREMGLIGKTHPHLIEILDGGYCAEFDVHFVVMNFFAGTNLAKVRDRVPHDRVRLLISQVAAAAKFLEELNLVHRDIKPENIGIDVELKHAVLLDLGVIRPIGTDPVTDAEATKVFIGTLQYSSPEFLLREEVDSVDGWRALTFYQLGGVLHDLIMRKPLFHASASPFVKLANAVQHETPLVESATVPIDLVELTRNCLVKPPALRLQLVDWKNFDSNPVRSSPVDEIKERKELVAQLRLQLQAYPDELLGVVCPNVKLLQEVWRQIKATDLAALCVCQDRNEGYSALTKETRICLSTIHSAKGLEFRALHIVGLSGLAKTGQSLTRNVTYTGVTRAKTALSLYPCGKMPAFLASAISSLEKPPPEPKLDDLFNNS